MHRIAALAASVLGLGLVACSASAGDAATTSEDVSASAVHDVATAGWARVAIDGDTVYFTDENAGTVSKVARAGGAATVLWHGHGSTGEIAVDHGVVYFGVGNRILSVPANGGAATTLVSLSREGASYLAVDGDWVYWAGETDFAADYTAYIRRVPKTGGHWENVYTGYQGVTTFAVRDGNAYFGGTDGTIVMNPPQRLMRVAGSGGTPVELLNTPRLINTITVDRTSVYAATADNGWQIIAVPVGGGAPTTLVSLPLADTNEVHNLAIAANTLYWTSPGTFDFSHADPDNHDATVWSLPITGGTPAILADHLASANAITATANCAVWADNKSVETACG